MNVQVANKVCILFDELISEYFKESALFNEDPQGYIKNTGFVFRGTIDPSSKEEFEEIKKRLESNIPTVRQLHKNNKTVGLTNDIAEKLSKSNQLNYIPYEMSSSVENITFDFINRLLYNCPLSEVDQKKLLNDVVCEHISKLKRESSMFEFKFPVHIIGLNDSFNFNERVFLDKYDNSLVDIKEMEKYLSSRSFEPNYNICLSSKIKTSYKFAEKRAIRANNATLNILLTLYGCSCGDSNWVSPIIRAENKKQHFFTYFLSGKKGESLGKNKSYDFNYNRELYEKFWTVFNNNLIAQGKLYKLLFSIPDRIMSNVNFEQSVCYLIERSLKWFSDAIDEQDFEIKVVKLTIAIESLVNFKSDSKKNDLESDRFKKMFVDRVCIINESDNDAQRKAIELYNARSSVAHGSSIKSNFDFDVVLFTATTLLLSIQLFSLFGKNGLDETKFSKTLPDFIDMRSSTSSVAI